MNAACERRAYTLTRSESRRLTLDDCTRQFAESGYDEGPAYVGPIRLTSSLYFSDTAPQVVTVMLAVADGTMGEEALAAWLREHVTPA